MKKKLLALAVLAMTSTGAFAQAKNFEGFTAGLNLGSVGGSTKFATDGGSLNFGEQSFGAGLELGYNFAASNDVVLGLTATYDFTEAALGSAKADAVGESALKGKNHYSINFKPGFMVTPNTMAYAVVGYNGLSLSALGVSKTASGFGYGLGIATMATKNIYLKAEFQQVNYSAISEGGLSATANTTVGTIGVGYKF